MERPTDEDLVLRYAREFGHYPKELLRLEVVREVECPYCHAEPGKPCKGVRGLRKTNHESRCFERIRVELKRRQDPAD